MSIEVLGALQWYYNIGQGSRFRPYELIYSDWPAELMSKEFYDFVHGSIWAPFENASQGMTIRQKVPFEIKGLCKQCPTRVDTEINSQKVTLHPILSSIAHDVFEATDHNPALTWQALTTAVLSSAYHDWLPAFSTSRPMTITSVVQRLQPLRRRGYTITMVNIALHLLTTSVVLVWFLRRTHHSLLNNAWQAVSQTISPETGAVLRDATRVGDKDVAAVIKNMEADSGDAKETRIVLRQGLANRVHVSRL